MTPLQNAIAKALRNPVLFSQHIIGRPLRWYQAAPVTAIARGIAAHTGHTFTLMFARQMGKNETSAHLEAFLLNRYSRRGGTIIKTAPTFQPQVLNSKLRLLTVLNNPIDADRWTTRDGNTVAIGAASAMFLSGNPEAHVVGQTASLLLEIDEAQDFDEQKYDKEFRPMASTTNATTVMYGTAWTGDTLLEKQIDLNKELDAADHQQRHFQYDWQVLADMSPAYRAFVETERTRLGENHPLFRTQYALKTISGQERLLNSIQLAQLHGNHARQTEPTLGKQYVAGLDLAGESEQTATDIINSGQPARDSVVLTIAELSFQDTTPDLQQPAIHVVEHYEWIGRKHHELYATLVDILRNIWACTHVAVDATGVGAGMASFLQQVMGSIIEQFIFTVPSKSALGYDLLAATNAGRIKIYTQNADAQTAATMWNQLKYAQYTVRANQALNFYVPPTDGHDDYLMSLALCLRAAQGAVNPHPHAQTTPRPLYNDGRY